jgi:hypothetical protein
METAPPSRIMLGGTVPELEIAIPQLIEYVRGSTRLLKNGAGFREQVATGRSMTVPPVPNCPRQHKRPQLLPPRLGPFFGSSKSGTGPVRRNKVTSRPILSECGVVNASTSWRPQALLSSRWLLSLAFWQRPSFSSLPERLRSLALSSVRYLLTRPENCSAWISLQRISSP